MRNKISFPWGDSSLEIDLPDSWRILGELKPEPLDPVPDVYASCRESLLRPISAQRLSGRQLRDARITLVVDDHSRPTPVREFLGAVMDELVSGGVQTSNMSILIATGVHRSSTEEEVEAKIGPEIMEKYAWSCHDAYDPDNLVSLGTTSRGVQVFLNKLLVMSDLIVCVGAIEPHLLLGFGGGLKMIIPGCAGVQTIGANHMCGVDPDHFNFVGMQSDSSPMRQDLEEGASMLNKDVFIVNVAMNQASQPVKFFCGDPIKAHRAGEEFVRDHSCMSVKEQADVVITNSFPLDSDLRQSVKCLGNALYISKPSGIVLGCARAVNGLGEMPLADRTLPYKAMRALLKIIGKNRVLPLVAKVKRNQPVEEVFVGHFGLQMLRRNHLGIFSDSKRLPDNIGARMGLATSFTDVQKMIHWAQKNAPKNAKVWTVPYGGSTFCITG